MERTPLVTFSHLRWSSFQRPHHIMIRLAEHREILFVEEPVVDGAVAGLEITRVAPRIRVVQAHLPVGGPGYGIRQQRILQSHLERLLEREGWDQFAAWLDTPMAVPLARALHPRAIVYDCTAHRSQSLQAPEELIQRERELLECADTVFTDGPSLFRATQRFHPYVHCFPSSVDREHFASANSISETREQVRLPRPRLGYAGGIDERMDLDIIRHLATSRPKWQIVLVGQVSKFVRAALPWGANLRYMGQQPYHDLPSFFAGWDVCILPLARNEATRTISPTEVLESMAADRPIVSTPIKGVAEPYGDIVHLGDGPQGFLEACERAMNQSEEERAVRRDRARRVLAQTSWDETVRQMEIILRRIAGDSSDRSARVAEGASSRSFT
jgi:UDP-galactopyranose mutase